MNGIINVYKEAGYTSHDVVARLRGILKQKRIGHTGTLDPAATGVLPVCVGRSTVLSDMVADGEKVYEAVLLLGVRTDTCDLEGKVLEEHTVTCSPAEAKACVKSFIGEQDQLPPMYSAVKVGGKKLYELARKGIEVERKPRRVTIFDITIKETVLPRIRMEITCSKGTYIRSLCSDIGDALGCGGCMAELVRTRVGIFGIDEAHKLDEIKAAAEEGRFSGMIKSPDFFFADCPAVRTRPEADRAARNGNRVSPGQLMTEEGDGPFPELPRGTEMFRLYDSTGIFIGLFIKDSDVLKPFKMLLTDEG